jgi:tRNA A-37 threonylcarbamoyl transferase component Bud32
VAVAAEAAAALEEAAVEAPEKTVEEQPLAEVLPEERAAEAEGEAPGPEEAALTEVEPLPPYRTERHRALGVRAPLPHVYAPRDTPYPTLNVARTRVFVTSPQPEPLQIELYEWSEEQEGVAPQAWMEIDLPDDLPIGTPIDVALGLGEDEAAVVTVQWPAAGGEGVESATYTEWQPAVPATREEPAAEEPVSEAQEEPVEVVEAIPEEAPPPEPEGPRYGRYRVRELLESRSRYQSYLAEDPETETPVLLRVFPARDERSKAAFLNSLLPMTLQHPNVVQVLDFGKADEHVFLVLEHVDGHTLQDHIRQKGDLEALDLFQQACAGLQAVHELGIYHRNIKPSNIVVGTAENGEPVAKLTDFDLAVVLREGEHAAQVVGTLPYMAKEVLDKHADRRADLYAMGVTLYELVTGKLPFWAGNQRELIEQIRTATPAAPKTVQKDLPDYVNDVILQAMEKDLHQRFQTVEELLDALVPDPSRMMKTIIGGIDA